MTRRLLVKDRKAEHLAKKDATADYYLILDCIRETGKVNMCGAAPHLRSIVGEDEMTRRESIEVTKKWMQEKRLVGNVREDDFPEPIQRKLRVKTQPSDS